MSVRDFGAGAQTKVVVSGNSADALDGIGLPDVALALWTRRAPVDINSVDLAMVDNVSFHASGSAPIAPLRKAGYPMDVAAALADDIALLTVLQRRLTGVAAIKVRLDLIETDACRRFHADYVTLRMLCTYYGAGTQWCRTADAGTVHQLATGNVGVFKGRIAMEEPTILHRSPPLRVTGGQRLLLVLDPA